MLRLIIVLCILWTSQIEALFRPILPRLGCFIRFGLLRFNVENFKRYPKYFHEDSTMTLAQAGTYTGPSEIEEYVRFAVASPLLDSFERKRQKVKFTGYDRSSKICTFQVMFDGHYVGNTERTISYGNETLRVATWLKLDFDFRKRYIVDTYVYYTDQWLYFFFGVALNSDVTRDYVCSVYEDACATVLAKPDNCAEQLKTLAEGYNGTYVDGNSQGCRILHAVMATINEKHCPHISFEPMEDYKGRVKCNESAYLTPDMFFEDREIDIFEKYMVDTGFDPAVGFIVDGRDSV